MLTIIIMVLLFWKAAAIDKESRGPTPTYSLGVEYLMDDIARVQAQIDALERHIEELKRLKLEMEKQYECEQLNSEDKI